MGQDEDIAALLASAQGLHASGQASETQALYWRILAQQPEHPQALARLGLILVDQSEMAEAFPYKRRHAPPIREAFSRLLLQRAGRA